MLTIGKLYGVMHATTPTGMRRAIAPMSPPGASAVAGISCGGSGITVGSSAPRGVASRSAPRPAAPASACRRVAVQPVSAITSGTQIVEACPDRLGRALAAARPAPRASSATTRGTPRGAAARRVVRLRGRRLGREADDLLGGRVDDVVAAVGAVDPVPADQQLAVPSSSYVDCASRAEE